MSVRPIHHWRDRNMWFLALFLHNRAVLAQNVLLLQSLHLLGINLFMRFLFLIPLLFVLIVPVSAAAQEGADPFRSTEYPLPRFVSLRADKVYARTGPGTRYPIRWVFQKKGLPVEIILEYDTWRKIRDIEGSEGWVHQSLLSGARSAIVLGEGNMALHRKDSADSRVLAYAEPQVVVGIEKCRKDWCLADAAGYRGWVSKNNIWGVYPPEIFD
jgi:SH3-like domain-containing protein